MPKEKKLKVKNDLGYPVRSCGKSFLPKCNDTIVPTTRSVLSHYFFIFESGGLIETFIY